MTETRPTTSPTPSGIHPRSDSVDQWMQRVAELEQQLVAMTRERDEFKATAYELYSQLYPADLSEDWLNDPLGKPVMESVAEYLDSHKG